MKVFGRLFAFLLAICLGLLVLGPWCAEGAQYSQPSRRPVAQRGGRSVLIGNALLDDDDDDDDREDEDEGEEFEDADDVEDDDDEVEIPEPPPALMTGALGDTIHLKSGRRILGVVVVRKAPTAVKYESFFDHPMNARRYMQSVSIFDVDRVERSTEDDRARLRAAWDRKLAQVEVYKRQIKDSGLVMFRGKYVTPKEVEDVRRREQVRESQMRQMQAARRETAQQRAGERTATMARDRRRQVVSSLRAGQNAAVLNMLGSPSSRRDMPLVTGVVQTEVVWRDLGLRVIVQNGYVAFVERFASEPVPSRPAGPQTGVSGQPPPASPGQ